MKKTTQEKLTAVHNLLKSGNPEKALQLIDKEIHDPELLNARGVCLLRLNKIDPAMEAFKEIAFQNFICIPPTTPRLYVANYLTALILKGNTQTALDLEKMLRDGDHPYVAALQQAMRNFKRALPWHRRILGWVNLYPNKPLPLPFEPGAV